MKPSKKFSPAPYSSDDSIIEIGWDNHSPSPSKCFFRKGTIKENGRILKFSPELKEKNIQSPQKMDKLEDNLLSLGLQENMVLNSGRKNKAVHRRACKRRSTERKQNANISEELKSFLRKVNNSEMKPKMSIPSRRSPRFTKLEISSEDIFDSTLFSDTMNDSMLQELNNIDSKNQPIGNNNSVNSKTSPLKKNTSQLQPYTLEQPRKYEVLVENNMEDGFEEIMSSQNDLLNKIEKKFLKKRSSSYVTQLQTVQGKKKYTSTPKRKMFVELNDSENIDNILKRLDDREHCQTVFKSKRNFSFVTTLPYIEESVILSSDNTNGTLSKKSALKKLSNEGSMGVFDIEPPVKKVFKGTFEEKSSSRVLTRAYTADEISRKRKDARDRLMKSWSSKCR